MSHGGAAFVAAPPVETKRNEETNRMMKSMKAALVAATFWCGLGAADAQQGDRSALPVAADPMQHALRIASLIDQNDVGAAAREILTSLNSSASAQDFAGQLASMPPRGPVRHAAVAADRTIPNVARVICLYRARETRDQFGFFFYIYVYRYSDIGWRLTHFRYNEVGNEFLPPGCDGTGVAAR